jgi:PAS domain S-box-containing protein
LREIPDWRNKELRSTGYFVLLVDDDPDHLAFQKNSIQKIDSVELVETANNAREAIEILRNNKVDLIILDYNLPDTDGLLFLESLQDYKIDIPVVMVTGQGDEKIAVQAMKLGACDYIVKDMDYLKTLPSVILRTLEKLHLSQSLKETKEQLQATEERYQKLYENANTGFVSVDLKTGKLIKPNKKLLEMARLSRHQISGMYFYDLAAPDDRDKLVVYQVQRLSGKWEESESPSSFEFWLNSHGEADSYVSCTVTMLPQIDEMFITLNDITDRKILEEKLQKANEQLQKHSLELESRVDELQKRLVIEPALENITEAEQQYNLDYSSSYLIKENRPLISYEIFKDIVSHGVFGLVISRTHASRIQKLCNLEKTPVIWLSKSDDESSISGTNLPGLLNTIIEFIEKSCRSIIILDGVEFLITVNGFDRCIQFLNDLFEVIMTTDTMLLIPINHHAIDRKELAILERATEELIDR